MPSAPTFTSEAPGDAGPPAFWKRLTDGADPALRRRAVIWSFCLIALIGAVDFWSGFQISLLVFYFVPVALAVAAAGWRTGCVAAALSVCTWLAGDFAAGARFSSPLIPCWNALIAFGTYLILVWLVAGLLGLHRELEARVRQRTAALRTEIAERERLEKAVLEISERERFSIGRDLHDGLGQHLTGTALLAQAAAGRLAGRSAPEAAEVAKIVRLVEQGIEQTRSLARGLLLTAIERDGLVTACAELMAATQAQFGVECRFEAEGEPTVPESGVATHLFRIVQEAVRNAARHAKPRHIRLRLTADEERLCCVVTDDGSGLPDEAASGSGLGLRIMAHRAAIIGADFRIRRLPQGGTEMTCQLPL